MKSSNNTKTRVEKLVNELTVLTEAMQERNDWQAERIQSLEQSQQFIMRDFADVFYKNLDERCTYEDAIDLLDEWKADFKNIDTTGFLIDIIAELGIQIDREYLKGKFDNEK